MTLRSILLAAVGKLSRPRRGEGLLYYSQTDRKLHLVDDRGTDTALGAGGGVSSPVPVADGGTAITSYTAGDLLYASGATTLAKLAAGTSGDQLRQGASSTPTWAASSGEWGDGSDGVVAFDGTTTFAGFATTTGAAPNLVYTLTRDVQATNVSISSGITVNTGCFQLIATGTFSGAGTLAADGAAASGTTGGSGYVNAGSLWISSGSGANGRTTSGAGANANNQTNVVGAAGGNGGASGGGSAGGNAGTATAPAAAIGAWKRSVGYSLRQCRLLSSGTLAQSVGGSGGGAGGCTPSTGTANSGGGGSAAGVVQVWARYVTFTGTLRAKGGAGANATNTGAGQAGGGGGGGGGHVRVNTTTPTASYTVDVTGGAGGGGANGGSTGATGSTGTSAHIVI